MHLSVYVIWEQNPHSSCQNVFQSSAEANMRIWQFVKVNQISSSVTVFSLRNSVWPDTAVYSLTSIATLRGNKNNNNNNHIAISKAPSSPHFISSIVKLQAAMHCSGVMVRLCVPVNFPSRRLKWAWRTMRLFQWAFCPPSLASNTVAATKSSESSSNTNLWSMNAPRVRNLSEMLAEPH